MQRRALVDQLAVEPQPRGAARAEVKEGRLRPGRAQNRGRVDRHVGARIDRRAQVDEAVRSVARGQRPPGHVVLLAGVHRLRVEAVLLRRILREEPAASLVLEGPDHAPRADGRQLLEFTGRLWKLSLRDQKLGANLEGERAHVGPRPGRAGGFVQRGDQRGQVALLLAALVQPEEVRHGLRPVELLEDARFECRRPRVEGDGCRGGERCQEEKAVHSFGLPESGQRGRPARDKRRVEPPHSSRLQRIL